MTLFKKEDEVTTIGMPPGIGDLHWIMTKLESFKKENNIKKIRVRMNLGWLESQSIHLYSLDYLKLIPFIDSAESIEEIIPFEYALAGGSGTPLFKNHGGCDYMIEFNSCLENGMKLKDILPEYDTNFDYPIDRPPAAERYAETLKQKVGGKLVLLFTASTEGNDIWARELWTPTDWMDLARKIYKETKCRLVLIGAAWDKKYAEIISGLDHEKIIFDIVGNTSVAQLFALLRTADVLVGYQCGVVMMSVHFRTPTVGFWPIKSRLNSDGQFKRVFMSSWIPPWAEGNGFMPFAFGDKDATPDGVFTAIGRYL